MIVSVFEMMRMWRLIVCFLVFESNIKCIFLTRAVSCQTILDEYKSNKFDQNNDDQTRNVSLLRTAKQVIQDKIDIVLDNLRAEQLGQSSPK